MLTCFRVTERIALMNGDEQDQVMDLKHIGWIKLQQLVFTILLILSILSTFF